MSNLSNKCRSFESVQEKNDNFLKLFPHRWDFIYAKHPQSDEKADWRTESKYPLSDRSILQGECLYGVRFGSQTNYLMIDVDPTSLYHPKEDPLAIVRLMSALEPIGLVAYVPVQSSYRGGIHLYFPFEEAQSSWAIALSVQTLLKTAGFIIQSGQLEIFPNARNPVVDDHPPLYNGHRLPLQMGSYILNEDWAPIYSNQAFFVSQWNFARRRNVLDRQMIKRVQKKAQWQQSQVRGKAQKFLNDLNIEIEPGWTASGQTNWILGKIACRERVFHHILHGGQPLTGKSLEEAIVRVAQTLPGYEEFCAHQHELEKRAREYARSAENRYYPLGSKKGLQAEGKVHHVAELTWNQRQAGEARERIGKAIADMLSQGTLPPQATDRFKALKQYGIGSSTLYANKDLWHPQEVDSLQGDKFLPPVPDSPASESLESLPSEQFPPTEANKFVGLAGLDAPPEQSKASPTNNPGGYGGFSTTEKVEGVQLVLSCLAQIKADSVAKLVCRASVPPDEHYFRWLFRQAKNSKNTVPAD